MSLSTIHKIIESDSIQSTTSTESNTDLPSFERWGLDPADFELDITEFSLSKATRIFFEQIAGLRQCKLEADCTYAEITSGVLQDPKYESFGRSPTQEGLFTVEEVINDANAKKDSFEDLLDSILRQLEMDPNKQILFEEYCGETSYKVLTLVPLKSERRCRAKTHDEYEGNAKFLCDVGRATIVCQTEDQIVQVMEDIVEKSHVVRMKNRFIRPSYTGIRDVLMNVKVDGHVFEIQIHLAGILEVDKARNAHKLYEYFRNYFVGASDSFMYKEREKFFFRMGCPSTLDSMSSFGNSSIDFDPRRSFCNSNDITQGIQAIIEGDDMDELEALEDISKIFAMHDLTLQAQKRILSLQLFEGYEDEEALLDRFHDMADVHGEQGDYKTAMEWYERALEGYEAILGKQHPSTLNTINNMAIVYQKQNAYRRASVARRSCCW